MKRAILLAVLLFFALSPLSVRAGGPIPRNSATTHNRVWSDNSFMRNMYWNRIHQEALLNGRIWRRLHLGIETEVPDMIMTDKYEVLNSRMPLPFSGRWGRYKVSSAMNYKRNLLDGDTMFFSVVFDRKFK